MAGDDVDVDDLIAGLGDDSDDDSDLGLPGSDADQAAAEAGDGPKATERAWEDWREYFDPGSQNYYYHNGITGEVQWEAPAAAPADVFAFDHPEQDEILPSILAEPGAAEIAPEAAVTDVLAEANLGSDDEDTESDDEDCGLMGVLSTSPRMQAEAKAASPASIEKPSAAEVVASDKVQVEKKSLQPEVAVAKYKDPSMEASPQSAFVESSVAVPHNVAHNAAMGVALKNSQSAAPAFAQEAAPRREAVEQPMAFSEGAAIRSQAAVLRSQAACYKQASKEPTTPLKIPGAKPVQASSRNAGERAQDGRVEQGPIVNTIPSGDGALSLKDAGLSSLASIQLDTHPPLVSLCLAGNAFGEHRELASQLSRLEALTNLDISQCRLTQLPLLVHCRSLEVFNASDNLIASSRGLLYCTSLRRVLLGRNRLRHVEQMETLKKLEELDVSQNRLGPTPGAALRALGGCAALRVLNVSGNPFAKTDHRSQVRNLIPSLVMIDGHPAQRRLLPASAATPVRSGARSGAKASRPATEPRIAAARAGTRAKNQEPGAAEATKPAEQHIPVSSPQDAGVSGFSPLKPAPTDLSELALHAAAMQREFATMFSSRPRPPDFTASSIVEASLLSSIIAESPAPPRHVPVSQAPAGSPLAGSMSELPVLQVYSPPPPVLQVYSPLPAGIAPSEGRSSWRVGSVEGIAFSSAFPMESPAPCGRSPASTHEASGLLPLGLSSLGSPLRSSEPCGPKSPCRTGGRRVGNAPVTSSTPVHEEMPSAQTSIPLVSGLPLASPVPPHGSSPLPPALQCLQAASVAVYCGAGESSIEDQLDHSMKFVQRVAPRSLNLAESALTPSPSPLPGNEKDLHALRDSLRDFIGHKRALVEQLRSS